MNQPIVITADRLFDGHEVKENVTVVAGNDRIQHIEPSATSRASERYPAAETLHAPFLMPGLIDSHVHLQGFPSGLQGPPAQPPFALAENFLRLLISNGVTAVRDTGNYVETTRYCKRWSQSHDGPRVFPTSPLLDRPPLLWGFSRIIDGTEQARQAVDELHDAGARWISLFHNLPHPYVVAAAARARDLGLNVTADVRSTAPQDVIAANVTSIEHAENLLRRTGTTSDVASNGHSRNASTTNGHADSNTTENTSTVGQMQYLSNMDLDGGEIRRLTDALLEHDTAVCPTLLYSHRWCSVDDMIHEPNLEYMVAVMPAVEQMLGMRSTMGQMFGKSRFRRRLGLSKRSAAEQAEVDLGLHKLGELVTRMHEAGVRIITGTDTPSPSLVPGFSLHQEMELMVRGGMAPADVLASTTAEPARLLERDDLGVIREGATADLLVIDGNPLAQIGDTRRVKAVFKSGARVDRTAMFAPIQSLADQVT
jgi:hypothetical protein